MSKHSFCQACYNIKHGISTRLFVPHTCDAEEERPDKFKYDHRVTPEVITTQEFDEVLVFGSNTEGRHGKGAALLALKEFGAIYGQSRGRQGDSYAIVTKDLKKGERSIPLYAIRAEVNDFIRYAKEHPDTPFYVVSIGCSLAGFKVEEIAPMFEAALEVPNIKLPNRFWVEILYGGKTYEHI